MLTQRDKSILNFIEEYKSITIFQAARMFWRENKDGKSIKFSYDHARKRLAILYKMGLLKQGKNHITDEYIYYMDKQITPHDLFIIDFYSMLIFHGAEIIECKRKPRYYIGNRYIEPDAFFIYKFNDIIRGVFVEIDFTHATTLEKYEPYFKDEFKKLYGDNPYICIVSDNPKKQKSSFDVVYLDTKLTDFVLNILG